MAPSLKLRLIILKAAVPFGYSHAIAASAVKTMIVTLEPTSAVATAVTVAIIAIITATVIVLKTVSATSAVNVNLIAFFLH
jgi:hypothetical protein